MFETILNITKNILSSSTIIKNKIEKISKKRQKLLEDLDYPFKVTGNMIQRCGDKMSLKDKIILEIGPGNFLINGLIYLSHGARKVYLIDKYKHLFWDQHDIAFHKLIIDKITRSNMPYSREALKAVVFEENAVKFDREKIIFKQEDVKHLSLESDSIDIIFSNAVLEHVPRLKEAVDEMSRVLKPGGIGVHEIDLRDHFSSDNPLKLLSYPDWLWIMMTSNRPGFTNRLRFTDYIDLFNKAYFTIEKQYIQLEYEGDLSEIKINKKFQKYTPDNLKILTFWIKTVKN
jgi:SAM-dependent methyltransferase